MIYKEIIQTFIFFLVKRFQFSDLKNFLFNLKKEKKFFKIENFIKNNGFFSAKFFLNPLKIIPLIKRFVFFILKNSKKIFDESSLTISKFFPAFKFSYKEMVSFFPVPSLIEPINLNQLVWIQGIIQEISPPLIKKLNKEKFSFTKKKNQSKSENFQSKLKKYLRFKILKNSWKEKFPLVNYQETKIFIPKRQNIKTKTKKFSEFNVVFSDNMVGKLFPGENISILGILKRRCDSFLDISKISFETNFLIEAIYAKIKKKKNSWKRLLEKKKVSVIDFRNIWQDSKIKGTGLIERKNFFKYFLKTLRFSYYSKLLAILSMIGGFRQNLKKTQKQNNSCNSLVISQKEFRPSLFFKKIQNFWMDYIDLTFETSPKKISNVYLNRDEKKWNQISYFSTFFSSGIITINNYQINEKILPITFFSFLNPLIMNFFNSKIRRKMRINSTIFLSIYSNQENLDFKKFDMNFLSKKKKTSKGLKESWVQFFSLFDIYLIFKKKNVLEISKKEKKHWFSTINNFRKKEVFNNKNYKKWKERNLKSYFFFVKAYKYLNFNKKAEKFLISFYSYEISTNYISKKPVLTLEKIIRLSEANARILSRDEIQIQDCILAIFIINKSYSFYKKKRKFFKKKEFGERKMKTLFLNKIYQFLFKKFFFSSYEDYFSLCGANLQRF
ncbi:hypothetical protein HAN_1g121 (nucleomorph) [Hemiselmis andersenii]|uniref:Uncharacterized protein n=2 Tax=Hemiselmis andersenii TaxID=464988 RepID=A9BKC8_HEMAN|nr:hypothetical protein HAN_1g121 [Hemiselmis andersenii]ABW97961.1 hypothetical protein HAN_1g121 [Hemiselmis andersenii]